MLNIKYRYKAKPKVKTKPETKAMFLISGYFVIGLILNEIISLLG